MGRILVTSSYCYYIQQEGIKRTFLQDIINKTKLAPLLNSLNTYNNKFSDFWLFDADYFRIKNITLGYTFQKNVVQSLGVEALKLYVAAENPFTIRADHRMEDFDPETASGRGGNTRGTASLSFGVNLTF